MHQLENRYRQMGFPFIAGVDEAGRGPLAGPVVAAAVILPADYRNEGIADSKVLTPLQREQLFVEIRNVAVSYSVSVISGKQIDDMGILEAVRLGMRQAVMKLSPTPDFILSDAVPLNVPGIPQQAIIKGDAQVFSIAAASILAKVSRDRLMMKYHKKYPAYGFDRHMGYGTDVHFEAIRKHGPCPIHRMSFSPLSQKD
jgi:ribonuclease HII